ncbi:MAG TPA: hypothetical protein VMN58_04880 [Acidimicrobiales bacterium]|nr:hypothetical protein [Acidimicrobiales bacterium]
MLPESLDADTIKGLALGTIVILGVAAVVVIRFVTKAVLRLVIVAVLFVVGAGIWSQRATLSDCAERARSTPGPVTCELFGVEVQVRD